MRRVRPLILLLFFLSGATALVYQVIWTRMLALVFGSTVFAMSTVLAAFMGGLALGSYYFGRRADQTKRPLRLYACFEAGIGLFALLFPLVRIGLQSVYVVIHHHMGGSFYALSFVRFLFAFVVLLIPTTLMGATLPALSRFFVARQQQLGWDIGRLYSLNTLGAVVGTLATAFLLIESIGVIGSLYLAAALNLLIATVSFLLDRRQLPGQQATTDVELQSQPAPRYVRMALVAFAVSGFCALSYEVLWTRILVFFLGSTTYAFATMLAAFLTGVAVGSFVFGKIADRQRRLVVLLTFSQIGIGLLALLLLPAFDELYAIRSHFSASRAGAFFACVSVMLLPTILMGATFPLVTRIYAVEFRRLGSMLGRMYALNTVGAILGSFMAGFIVVPWLGIQRGVLLIAAFNLIVGALLYFFDPDVKPRSQWILGSATGVTILLGFLLVPANKPIVLKSAIFQYENPGGKLLAYEEGVDATVTAVEDQEGIRRLYVDTNQAAEDSRWDSPSHRVIAHLPLLLHPNPRRALVVGFGMGVTSYSITQHRVRVDAVEISPGVIKANRFFTQANQNILENPLFSITIDDGRNFILTTQHRYDMISTGIIHPLVSSGSSNIYTRDFYELCQRILTENGVMCQWVPLHRLPEAHYKTIIRTFMAVFPNTTLWYKYTPDFVILIGTPQPLEIDYQRLMARSQIRSIANGLEHDDLDGMSLLDSFMMGPDELREYVGPGPIHTDNRPRLEFFNSRDLVKTTYRNIQGMQPYRTSVLPYLSNIDAGNQKALQQYFQATQKLIEGQLLYVQARYEEAAQEFYQAAQLNPRDRTIEYNLNVATQYGIQEADKQFAGLEQELQAKLRQNPRDAETARLLGLIYQYQQKWEKAAEMLERALRYAPNQPDVYVSLGAIYEVQGDLDKAIQTYKTLVELAPDLPAAYGSLAAVYEQKGMLDEAIVAVQKAIELEPELWLAHSTLGGLYQSKGEHQLAIRAFNQAASLAPEQPRVAYGLAVSYRALGKEQEAVKQLERAAERNYLPAMLALARLNAQPEGDLQKAESLVNQVQQQESSSADAYDILALVRLYQGNRTAARELIREAIRLAPDERQFREHEELIEDDQ